MPMDPAETIVITNATVTNEDGAVSLAIEEASAPMQNKFFKIPAELAIKLHQDLGAVLSQNRSN